MKQDQVRLGKSSSTLEQFDYSAGSPCPLPPSPFLAQLLGIKLPLHRAPEPCPGRSAQEVPSWVEDPLPSPYVHSPCPWAALKISGQWPETTERPGTLPNRRGPQEPRSAPYGHPARSLFLASAWTVAMVCPHVVRGAASTPRSVAPPEPTGPAEQGQREPREPPRRQA